MTSDIEIEKSLLNIICAAAQNAVCAETTPSFSEQSLNYLAGIAHKTFFADEIREGFVNSACDYEDIFTNDADAFVSVSAKITDKIFSITSQNATMPDADMVFLLLQIEGERYFAGLKLVYKSAYMYAYNSLGEGELQRYDTLLPANGTKAEEAFFINLATRKVKIMEKKYEIDGQKQNYFAGRILDCKMGHTAKEKLENIQNAAVEVNQRFFGSLGVDEADVAKAIGDEWREDGGALCAEKICERLYKDVPHAKEAFINIVEENDLPFKEEFTVSAPAARRMEKQSLRSGSGVEIKVPVSVYKDKNAVEFVKNDDGTTSIIVKNVLI